MFRIGMKRSRTGLLAAAVVLAGCGFMTSAQDGLQEGDAAPDFSLAGSDGQTYSLADFSGQKPVVIAWFPKAFTGG